jgi:tRNA pseudouridine38/39 synthase
MVELIIEGSSFLWHQIRAMTAVLFLVGQRKEEPSIIDELLNVNEWPCKPHYNITSEVPLVLFDCQYENLDWIYDRSNLDYVIKNLQDQWLEYNVKSTAIKRMIDSLVTKISDSPEMTDSVEKNQTKVSSRTLQQPYANLQGRSRSAEHIKLSKRKVVKSLEDRVQYYVKRKKIDEDLTNNKLAQAVKINKKLEEKYASNDNNNK